MFSLVEGMNEQGAHEANEAVIGVAWRYDAILMMMLLMLMMMMRVVWL